MVTETRDISSSLAFWLRSCGVAECVGDAVEQRGSEFLHLWRDLGREETLFPPDLAADSGERVGEGRALLAIPSSRRDRQTRLEAEPGGHERDQGEQPEQTRHGARDRLVRPLALGLDAEVVTHVPEGDFHLPALDEPGQDLQRIAGEVGAEEGLWVEAALGVSEEHPADRHGGPPSMVPNGGGGVDLDGALAPAIPTRHRDALPLRSRVDQRRGEARQALAPPPAPGAPCHCVAVSISAPERLARRWPLVRGRPRVPGLRGGAGS